jgi:hypothetical protein
MMLKRRPKSMIHAHRGDHGERSNPTASLALVGKTPALPGYCEQVTARECRPCLARRLPNDWAAIAPV